MPRKKLYKAADEAQEDDETITKCSKCTKRAFYYCHCSSEIMCSKHKSMHIDKNPLHPCGEIKNFLPDIKKALIISTIQENLKKLEDSLKLTISKTYNLISELQRMCQISLEAIKQKISEMNALWLSLNTELTYSQTQSIEVLLDFDVNLKNVDINKILDLYQSQLFSQKLINKLSSEMPKNEHLLPQKRPQAMSTPINANNIKSKKRILSCKTSKTVRITAKDSKKNAIQHKRKMIYSNDSRDSEQFSDEESNTSKESSDEESNEPEKSGEKKSNHYELSSHTESNRSEESSEEQSMDLFI